MEKPFSQSCENNKDPILRVLKEAFRDASFVLEIGSGTGQHAVYFARNLPHLTWQPSDLPENIPGMKLWFDEAGEKLLDQVQCLKGRIQPEDLARMVLFLASDDARMCSAQEFTVDGGWA